MQRAPAARHVGACALIALVVIGVSAAASLSTPAVPVKVSPRNEVTPVGGGGFFTWAKSRRGHPHIYDLWAQQENQAPFKVNPSNTWAFGGGIDGTNLVYQQIKNYNSDVRYFDLATRRRLATPAGVNTPRWEWGPSVSHDWLLFARGIYSGSEQLILQNMVTGEQRVLDSKRGKRGGISPGQVNGNYVVWSKCAGVTCDVFRYDIASGTRTAMPRSGRLPYAPSVVPSGAVYYVAGQLTCGNAQLVKTTLAGTSYVLYDSGSARDVSFTSAGVLSGRPPTEPPAVRVYFESRRCSTGRIDVYSIDDVEPVPPPGPAIR